MAAEILSRYIPKDYIDMHSFCTGTSLENKTANWNYLRKVVTSYKKLKPDFNLAIDEKEAQDISYRIPNCAFKFLIKLYTELNNKKLEEIKEPEIIEDPAAKGYERATISKKMKATDLQLILD